MDDEANLKAQLDSARQQLADAHLQISELQEQLDSTNKELTKCKQREQQQTVRSEVNNAPDGGVDSSKKRHSVVIPDWLESAALDIVNDDAADPNLVDNAHEGGPAHNGQIRFTADQMPDWLLRASTDVLECLDEEEDDAASSSRQDVASSTDPAAPSSCDDSADCTSLLLSASCEARVVAHTFVRGHIEHEVRVTVDEDSWVVHRRYSEFRALRDALAHALAPPEVVARDGVAAESDGSVLAPFAVPKLFLHTPAALRQRERLFEELLESCIRTAKDSQMPLALHQMEAFLGLRVVRSGSGEASSAARQVMVPAAEVALAVVL